MSSYTMKDLGYPRTPTTAMLRITMEHETWDVPAQIVADDRDSNYAYERENTIGFIREKSLDSYDLLDWAANNMNWSDVQKHAVAVQNPRIQDRQEGWVNGEKSIIGEL